MKKHMYPDAYCVVLITQAVNVPIPCKLAGIMEESDDMGEKNVIEQIVRDPY